MPRYITPRGKVLGTIEQDAARSPGPVRMRIREKSPTPTVNRNFLVVSPRRSQNTRCIVAVPNVLNRLLTHTHTHTHFTRAHIPHTPHTHTHTHTCFREICHTLEHVPYVNLHKYVYTKLSRCGENCKRSFKE